MKKKICKKIIGGIDIKIRLKKMNKNLKNIKKLEAKKTSL